MDESTVGSPRLVETADSQDRVLTDQPKIGHRSCEVS